MADRKFKPLSLKSKLNDGMEIGVCETDEVNNDPGDIIVWINRAEGGDRRGIIVNKTRFLHLLNKLKI